MSKTYLLIDLQNRHPAPEDVASWMGSDGAAWIFYGEHEIGLLAPYMELGDRVSLVDISRPQARPHRRITLPQWSGAITHVGKAVDQPLGA